MKTNELTRQAIIAAMYVALGLAFLPISFGAIQFRIAEMLMVFAFYNKKSIYGLTIGCFIVNMFSPFPIDMIVGTAGTFVSCLIISRLNSKHLIALTAAIVNGILVGIMITAYMGLTLTASIPAFMFNFAAVAIGEFVVVEIAVVVLAFLDKYEFLKPLKDN